MCTGTASLWALNRSKAGPTKRLVVLAQHYRSLSGVGTALLLVIRCWHSITTRCQVLAHLTAEVNINFRKAIFIIERSHSLLHQNNPHEEVSEVQTFCMFIFLRTSDSSPILECHQTAATQSPQGSTLVRGQHFGEGILVPRGNNTAKIPGSTRIGKEEEEEEEESKSRGERHGEDYTCIIMVALYEEL